MSGYPVVLDGAALTAVVVGGGAVATRKVAALLDAGARVVVVAPEVSSEIEQVAQQSERLRLSREAYSPAHLDGAALAIAATSDRSVNASVARDAKARGMFVNVVDAPEAGNCVTPAVYRSGDILVAVSTGRVPGAAARIRDRIAMVLDRRYADAVRTLTSMRRSLLDEGKRDAWHDASRALVGDDFCATVESGDFESRVAQWR